MKTVLSQFCEEFDAVARPLLDPLRSTAETLGHVDAELPVRTVLPQLRDLEHNLNVLTDKVAGQQAYVLIFGPLKSGKSTLMNAIAASYVSEVTTLPAYPCMVFVSGAPEHSFQITRYDGSKQTLDDTEQMHTVMEKAHKELAVRLREVESRGETFDPGTHMPQAIRRVDVKVPAPELASSSAVLVDTPGLYTRMKFGYDRMTRDFRDTAACAIFVVKTDNLFLEQVFDEFGDLLDLFSRMFLLVNIDSTKCDLRPDGGLQTSLEGEDPSRVIAAFENLAMSAPLKAARDEGRLGIYAVDLLRAASSRLRAHAGEEQGVLYDDVDPSAGDNDASAACDDFLTDLTDYLNSTDYLVAFLGDSLRQADRLMSELRALCGSDAVAGLDDQVQQLADEVELCHVRETALERLSAFAWRKAFGQLGDDLRSITEGRLAHRRESTREAVSATVDAWFESDDSFGSLMGHYVGPVLADVQQDLVRTARGVLETVAGNETAGAELPPPMREDMQTVGLVLIEQGRESVAAADEALQGHPLRSGIGTEHVAVRRSLMDWLLFRGKASVRKRLFGPADALDKEVPAALKLRRIGERGREQLRDAFLADLDRIFDEELSRLARRMLEAYVATVHDAVLETLERLQHQNHEKAEVAEARLTSLRRVLASTDELKSVLSSCGQSMTSLSSRYGETDAESLTEPAEGAEVVTGVGTGTEEA